LIGFIWSHYSKEYNSYTKLCKTFDEILLSSNALCNNYISKIMTANKSILAGILFAFLATATMLPLAAAQVYPTEKNGPTLEEELVLARQKVDEVKAHPGAGSGTPFLDANGVLGASIIVGAVFGGIFIAFITQAKRHAMVKMH
jgi:hypothetical protein